MRIRRLGALIFALALFWTGSATAAPPIIVAVGQVNQHPTATWTLPPGGQSSFIEVATAPSTGSDGYFFLENVVAADVPQATDTTWTSSYQLAPGTYYVQVAGEDTPCGACPFQEFSSIVTLVIPAPPPPPPLPPPPPPVTPTPPVISSATGDGKGLIAVMWTLPVGVTSTEIQISTDPTVDSVGFFSVASQVDFFATSASQTTYTSSRPQVPGTYYVHVAGNQPALPSMFVWSIATPVVVPARTPVAAAVKAPAVAKKTPKQGNARAVIRSLSKRYAASAGNLVRRIDACATFACVARQVTAFALTQLAYEHSVVKDVAQAAPCGAAARGLRARLRKSETSTSALHRAILLGQRGAHLKSTARTTGYQAGKAIALSQLYVAACG